MNEKLEELWLTFDDRPDRMKLYIGHEAREAPPCQRKRIPMNWRKHGSTLVTIVLMAIVVAVFFATVDIRPAQSCWDKVDELPRC